MRSLSQVGFLVVSAAVFISVYSVFLFFQPFQKQIPAFLLIYLSLCVFHLVYVLMLRVWNIKWDEASFWRTAAVVLIGALLMRGILFVTKPTLSDDVYRYVWDGRMQSAGINPYQHPPSDESLSFYRDDQYPLINHPHIRTIYPPMAQWVFRLGAFLRPTYQMQKAIFLMFDMGVVFLLLLFLKKRQMPAAMAGIYAWHPLPVIEFSSSGHMDSLMIFLLMAGLLLMEQQKNRLGSVVLGFAAVSKWIPFVMIPWIAKRLGLKKLAVFFLSAAFVSLFYLQGLSDVFSSWSLQSHGVHPFIQDWLFNASLYSMMGWIFPSPILRKLILGVLLILYSLWLARRHADPVQYSFLAIFALLLASPVVHPWYVVWLLPLAVLTRNSPAFVWACFVGLTYIVQIQYAAIGIWHLPIWVPVLEYVCVFGAFIFSYLRLDAAVWGKVKKLQAY